ncbi:hypothetical protein OIU79_012734 [Salix purpurea]|uniref:Uncharacterized protein n=1 Tax=Salix purpurea TaxID=77065 RepID=A0A9Q0Q4A8_SALPP|nr:hypothetical protein OIU79_012734 [Salix purpurea]
MERKKQTGPSSSSSSSSFTSDLFGSKEYPPSSMGIFGSIFAPTSPKVLGRESLRSEVADKKQDSANDAWNTNSGTPASDLTSKRNEGESQSTPNKDMSSIYQEQRSSHTSSMNPVFKKDGPEDDTGSASRGNWWQGGLYY